MANKLIYTCMVSVLVNQLAEHIKGLMQKRRISRALANGLDNGLVLTRHQAIIWANAEILDYC